MPTYAVYGGWIISIIAGWFEVTADSGLSATNVVRLKAGWEEEYKAWCQRDLSAKAYVYWWADGIYFNFRLDEERSCVLVLMGALEDGTKELLAIVDGYRESTHSWRELLQQLKRHGLTVAPKLAIGDGSLSFLARAPGRIWPGASTTLLGT